MPAKDFKFISPGVFINEIDNSQLPSDPGDIGPVVIGRATQGPGLVPTRVTSFQEFVEVFGTPVPGGEMRDVARTGINPGPTYGSYAAQAWLRNNSPLTFVRLVGQQHGDAADGGEAGWEIPSPDGTNNPSPQPGLYQAGAYGLFIIPSASAPLTTADAATTLTEQTGTLAAVWYVTSGSVALSGTIISGSGNALVADTGDPAGKFPGKAIGKFVKSTANGEFKVVISKGGGNIPGTDKDIEIDSKFNFNRGSENFIRKVFNTNPTLTNSIITDSTSNAYKGYWLGETYEDEVLNNIENTSFASAGQVGIILPLFGKDTVVGSDFKVDYSDPQTGDFFAQDLTSDREAYAPSKMEKLFKFRARNTGRWASRSVKISIADLRASSDPDNPYGTFSVLIRAMNDTDNRPKILEQFNNCNLNPTSENFVARKIGDKHLTWDDAERRYIEYGDYPNNSDYVYIILSEGVKEGKTNKQHLPFGVFGPPKFTSTTASADPAAVTTLVTGGFDAANPLSIIFTGVDADSGFGDATLVSGGHGFPVTLKFPDLRLRVSSSDANPTDPRSVFYGVDTTFNRGGRPSRTIGDYTGPKPFGVSSTTLTSTGDAQTEHSFVFTLDDMCTTDEGATINSVTGTLVYKSGSRADETAQGGLSYVRGTAAVSENYRKLLELGCDRFTTVLHGGFDGLDITEAEPFRNTLLNGKSETSNYAFNSIRVAIDSLRDPENVEFDLAAVPGLTNNVLNRNLIDMCEGRGDALAIIDLQGGYVPSTENTSDETVNLGDVDTTINNKRDSLQINSSFGCAYYPWVQIQDTINGAIIWAPPSVAALGAMSFGQATQELWFAPAGFTRGGLSVNGAAGIPVVGVRQRLIAKERDKLYEANINPIAQFPAEGIVIFGQKTLQVTPSALDRINVRRLLIFLKKEISRAAATLLFDQNVQTTWDRFRGQVEPFLASVKTRLGLTEYKLVLDKTTTTPDLIDRNILYAQIFLKPARAIEFIAVDFVITDSGASFDD